MNDVLLVSLVNTVAALLASTVKSPKTRKKLDKPLNLLMVAIATFLSPEEE